jgi:hypothetical protein
MARSARKGKGKEKATAAAPQVPPQQRKGPPPPFELPSEKLSSHFLSTLPQDHVYIVHVDTTLSAFKRQVFIVPICINIVLSCLLVWRACYALPMYLDLINGALGHSSPTVVNVKGSTRSQLVSVTISRTLMLLGDYLLYAWLGHWPWRFVLGVAATRYSSPVKWRRALGFQEREVIVRQSRSWVKSLRSDWTIDDELTLKHKIMPALEKKSLDKTGYSLEDKNWTLDFRAMIDAHSSILSGNLSLADFDKAVLVHYPPSNGLHGGWMVWHVSRADEPRTAEQRDRLVRFKDKLTAMGHEDLFFRWVELVQHESNTPGGFTPGRQAAAMREAKGMFSERGIDFARFWQDVGGTDGMPGLIGSGGGSTITNS